MSSSSEALMCLIFASVVACDGKHFEVLTRPASVVTPAQMDASFATQPDASTPSEDAAPSVPSGFVSAQGTSLYLDGTPYRFLSFNAYSLTGCDSETNGASDAQLEAFFASLRPRSLVRTYAFESLGLESVERVLDVAERHGHFLTLVLATHNGRCEDEIEKDTAWYTDGYRGSYLAWVETLVSALSERPGVGMWELINGPQNVDTATLRAFFDSVGGRIHQLAPNHLVQSGTHGPWAYGDADGYTTIHESPGIDVLSFRDYDQNEGPPPNLLSSVDVALAVNKPVILAEAGMLASRDGDPSVTLAQMTCVTWERRRQLFEGWLNEAFATELAGIHIWNWIPTLIEGCRYDMAADDPTIALVRDFPLP